jgi:transcriptional regulator with XRE-family HTH domain
MEKNRLRNIIGENIRHERMLRGMSIDELAELLGLTPGFIGLIERGCRGATAYTLFRLSQAFDISIDSLFMARDLSVLTVAEIDDNNINLIRKKIYSMTAKLTEREMEFVISVIKNVKVMNRFQEIDWDEE